jgi:hypothetical protein
MTPFDSGLPQDVPQKSNSKLSNSRYDYNFEFQLKMSPAGPCAFSCHANKRAFTLRCAAREQHVTCSFFVSPFKAE